MHFYIDESGNFLRNDSAENSISCTCALILPGRFLTEVLAGFKKLSLTWPCSDEAEVKGQKLNETHIAELCEFLLQFHPLLEVSVMDMNLCADSDVDAHKARQAEGLTETLTDEHQPEMVENVWRLRRQLEGMPRQIYAQSVALTDLVWRAFQHGQLYHCQRMPGELANYAWHIDAKNGHKVTWHEEWWRTCVMPQLQSRSLREPAKMLRGGDYSAYLRKFPLQKIPTFLDPHAKDRRGDKCHNLRSIFGNIEFKDSVDEPGIQIADVLSNAVRRALSGRLQRPGWKALEKLMIHSKQGAIVIKKFGHPTTRARPSYAGIVNEMNFGGRSMLVGRNHQ